MSGQHNGGYGDAMGGADANGHELTVAFGWGSQEGHTLLGDGTDRAGDGTPKTAREFHQHKNHNHYGPGDGPNDNVKDRGQYSGEGA